MTDKTTTPNDAKLYLAKHDIPRLFESLMTGLLYNQPDDHITFLEQCLAQIKDEGLASVTWNSFFDIQKKRKLPPISAGGGGDSERKLAEIPTATKPPTPGIAPGNPIAISQQPETPNVSESAPTALSPLPPISPQPPKDDEDEKDTAEIDAQTGRPKTAEKDETDLEKGREDIKSKIDFNQTPIVFVLGGPGAGKLNQIQMLLERYAGWVHVPMTDLKKDEIAMREATDEKLKMLHDLALEDGETDVEEIDVPELVAYLENFPDASGFIIEGFPRRIDQAVSWETKVNRTDMVLLLDCDDQVMLARLEQRLTKAGATEDNVSAIEEQIGLFRKNVHDVINHYEKEGRMAKINGDRDTNEVFYDICALFDNAFYRERDDKENIAWNAEAKILQEPVKTPLAPFNMATVPTKDDIRPDTATSPVLHIDKIHLVADDKGRMQGLPTAPLFFIMGGPGSGKSSHSMRLMERYEGFAHISMGDALRKAIAENQNDEKWQEMDKLIKQGDVVTPNAQVMEVLLKQLREHEQATAFILEGYPRNKEQLEDFNEKVGGMSSALLLDCEEYYLRKRLKDRRSKTGRLDDNEYAIDKRIKLFKANTLPIINYLYETQRLNVIGGDRDEEEIFFDLCNFFDTIVQKQKSEGATIPEEAIDETV